jgi:L-fucose isomerase-like protein
MNHTKVTFAIFFGNRGFFPASLVDAARRELSAVMSELGYGVIMLGKDATRNGGVETLEEGRKYAEFLRDNRGNFDGVILCLPNFGDENGAAAALGDVDVPILIHAYPDDLDKMSPDLRRDAFCGKLSVMDVFRQYGIKFTNIEPHVVPPSSSRFKANIDFFGSVCRVVAGVQGMSVGEIGARTTPFKTVRIDEVALQKHGITVETYDLSDIFGRMNEVSVTADIYKAKADSLKKLSTWEGVPGPALENLSKLGVVLDEVVVESGLDAISIRCWTELQQQFGISPCLVTGDLMNRHIPAACEVDTGSAVIMHALDCASGKPSMILDWNNNYGEEENKCILFHCGNVPCDMMTGKGRISDHPILAKSIGFGRGFGCNVGRIVPGDVTFSNLLTEEGKIKIYIGQGRFTEDEIPSDFFGCAGVAEIENLQKVLKYIGDTGHRHHVALANGHVQEAVSEAAGKYLGFEVAVPQRSR